MRQPSPSSTPNRLSFFLQPRSLILISLLAFLAMATLLKSSRTEWRDRLRSPSDADTSQMDDAEGNAVGEGWGKDKGIMGEGGDGQSMIALPGAGIVVGKQRMAFAHFMLGNTYPFTPTEWTSTLLLASQTGLDALALNLGPEPWQTEQLLSAYEILSNPASGTSSTGQQGNATQVPKGLALKLFISLDMTVLPSTSEEDMNTLVDLVVKCGKMNGQLIVPETMQSKPPKSASGSGGDPLGLLPLRHKRSPSRSGENTRRAAPPPPPKPSHLNSGVSASGRETRQLGSPSKGKGKVMLSTFGGQDASFGGKGWVGFKEACSAQGVDVFFAPAFFLPPSTVLKDDTLAVDAWFNWNSGWPFGDTSVTESGNNGEAEYLEGDKPYMAAASPWFFTHYGTTGPYAYNKNWIYRSDDNLYATRWNQILESDPQFVEVVSWSDFGESHYIGPILGAQPGSEAWTAGMDHEAWRLMTKDFVRMFKGLGPVSGDFGIVKLYLSYRTAPKGLVASDDSVGMPKDADWARDVIAIYALAPLNGIVAQGLTLTISTGGKQQLVPLEWDARGQFMGTVDFQPGPVSFSMANTAGVVLLEKQGAPIQSESKIYNFNAWTGHWSMGL